MHNSWTARLLAKVGKILIKIYRYYNTRNFKKPNTFHISLRPTFSIVLLSNWFSHRCGSYLNSRAESTHGTHFKPHFYSFAHRMLIQFLIYINPACCDKHLGTAMAPNANSKNFWRPRNFNALAVSKLLLLKWQWSSKEQHIYFTATTFQTNVKCSSIRYADLSSYIRLLSDYTFFIRALNHENFIILYVSDYRVNEYACNTIRIL